MLKGNPLTQRKFELEIGGVPTATIQEITLPKVEAESSSYFGGDGEIKNPGQRKVGDLELSKLLEPYDAEDRWNWLWLGQVIGLGGAPNVPSTAKRNGRLILRDDAGVISRVYAIEGAWVKAVDLGTLSKGSSDNVMEKVTLSVDKFYEVLA